MADAAQELGVSDQERRPCSIGYQNYSQCAIPAHVISAAKEKLSNAFGYDLRELLRYRPSSATQRHSTQQTDVAKAKSYVLISKLPAEVKPQKISFGITLKRMGLCETNVSHPPFGNANEKMKEYISEIDSKEVVPVDVDEAE
ncbi:hypothetical protein WN944_024634 [Citrus x changshan-huyou]|uniref:MAGE domain-containing protein n=1 Tax=Citrus x changshan-huyou TaxID=2935761 RepID=A0AAP0LNX7_9ROSI